MYEPGSAPSGGASRRASLAPAASVKPAQGALARARSSGTGRPSTGGAAARALNETGDWANSSSAAAHAQTDARRTNERRRPVHPAVAGRTHGNESWGFGRQTKPRVERVRRPKRARRRSAARLESILVLANNFSSSTVDHYSPFFASEAAGLKNRRTDPGVGQSAGTRSA